MGNPYQILDQFRSTQNLESRCAKSPSKVFCSSIFHVFHCFWKNTNICDIFVSKVLFTSWKQQILFFEKLSKRLKRRVFFDTYLHFSKSKNWILSGKGYHFLDVEKIQKFFPYRYFTLFLKSRLYSSKLKFHHLTDGPIERLDWLEKMNKNYQFA